MFLSKELMSQQYISKDKNCDTSHLVIYSKGITSFHKHLHDLPLLRVIYYGILSSFYDVYMDNHLIRF